VRGKEKAEVVAKIRQKLLSSEVVFVVRQNKITVAEVEGLRRKLREVNSSYQVAKNTLIRLAIKDTAFEVLRPNLTGQTALLFSRDITGAAKVIAEYASKNEEKVAVICGGYEGRLLSQGDVKVLSQLPSADELRAKLIAIIQTPAQRIAVLLKAPAGQLARVLRAYSDKN
jgi:large subunit ribosomal protein L10